MIYLCVYIYIYTYVAQKIEYAGQKNDWMASVIELSI